MPSAHAHADPLLKPAVFCACTRRSLTAHWCRLRMRKTTNCPCSNPHWCLLHMHTTTTNHLIYWRLLRTHISSVRRTRTTARQLPHVNSPPLPHPGSSGWLRQLLGGGGEGKGRDGATPAQWLAGPARHRGALWERGGCAPAEGGGESSRPLTAVSSRFPAPSRRAPSLRPAARI